MRSQKEINLYEKKIRLTFNAYAQTISMLVYENYLLRKEIEKLKNKG